MHVILWRFRVRPGREAEFETLYGGDGEWVRLFRTGAGYIGSELLRASDGTYLTIDRWESEGSFRSFQEAHAAPYDAIDRNGRGLTIEEAKVAAVEA